MAISTVTNRIEYQGNGTSATFAFPYRIDAQSHLSVFVFNSSGQAAAVITPMQLNAAGPFGYVFSGTANNQGIYTTGGNVVFNSTPNVQSAIVMFRSSVITSDFNVGQFGAIPATSLNNELDYLTMLQQRAQDLNTRSVRLQDGFYGTFDPTLPSNISQSPGKRLIVNSSATGWSFDETLQQYIPNTVVIATTNSSITSLGGDIPGRLLTSNGSAAPSWQGFNLNGGSVTGVLPVSNGGTGTGSIFNYGSMLYVGTSGLYSELLEMQWDDVAKVMIVGTTAAAGIRLNAAPSAPLRTDATGLISSGSTNLSNEATGINSVTTGGTGTGTSYIQFGVIYASSATQMGTVPPAQPGYVLTAQGSSAPTFQAVSVTNSVRTISSNDVVTSSDRYILTAGSTYSLALTAAATAGQEITIRNINQTSLLAAQSIVGSGCLINGRATLTLSTFGEQLDLTYDGTNWFGKRVIPSEWQRFGSSVIRATTTAPTKAFFIALDEVYFRRNLDSAEIRMNYKHTQINSTANGSGDYFWDFKQIGTFDLTKVRGSSTVEGTGAYNDNWIVGNATAGDNTNMFIGIASIYGSSSIRAIGSDNATNGSIGASFYQMNTANKWYSLNFSAPIVGWEST